MGSRLGHRRRARERGERDRPGARRAHDRHLLERRQARAHGRGREGQPRVRGRGRSGQGCNGRARCGRRRRVASGEATWQRSLQAARTGGRITVCGATSGPNPPAALHRIWWKQLTIYGSTMGTKDGLRGRLRARQERPGEADRRRGLPAERGESRARAHGGRRPARQDRAHDPRLARYAAASSTRAAKSA